MSYSPVYSTAFIQYTASTPNNQFEVPAGFTAIVREISVAQDIGGWIAYLDLQDDEAAPALTVWIGAADGLTNYAAGTGRWVLDEGGIMTLNASSLGDVPSMYAGGYLLAKTVS